MRCSKPSLEVSRRIVGAVTRLTWITAGYGWFTIIAPILVAAPGYFAGRMTFGELMMVVGAFNQVQTVASLVRRQFLHHRGLARHAVARGELSDETILTMDRLGRTRQPHRRGRGGTTGRSTSTTFTSPSPAGCIIAERDASRSEAR